MGFLKPKIPAPVVVDQKPAPTMDDDAVRRAGDEAAQRAAARRDSTDTILTGTVKRRAGGLAQASRTTTGGNPNA